VVDVVLVHVRGGERALAVHHRRAGAQQADERAVAALLVLDPSRAQVARRRAGKTSPTAASERSSRPPCAPRGRASASPHRASALPDRTSRTCRTTRPVLPTTPTWRSFVVPHLHRVAVGVGDERLDANPCAPNNPSRRASGTAAASASRSVGSITRQKRFTFSSLRSAGNRSMIVSDPR
jgi:hypothetical protein